MAGMIPEYRLNVPTMGRGFAVSSPSHPPQATAPGTLTAMDLNSRKRPPVELAAFDIDGTLMPSRGESMSGRTMGALRAAVAAGVEVVIATGRRAAYAMPLLEPIGLAPETVLISSNGASTREFGGNLMSCSYMDLETARSLCTELRSFGGTAVFTFDKVGPGELVLESLARLHERIALWVDANRGSIEEVEPLERVFDRGEAPMQGMMCGTVAQVEAAERHLLQTPYAEQVEMHRTEYAERDLSILDILPLGCNKGFALAKLARKRGIPREAVMAVGDNWNDLEMLRWAGQPVLMGNASAVLREEARRSGWQIAASNDEHGAAKAIEAALKAMRGARRPRQSAEMSA